MQRVMLDALADKAVTSASNAGLEAVLSGRENDLRNVLRRFRHRDHQREQVRARTVVHRPVELVPRRPLCVDLTLDLGLQLGHDPVYLLFRQPAVARVGEDVAVAAGFDVTISGDDESEK